MSKELFESSQQMPMGDNSPDVCRSALTLPEYRRNLESASYGRGYADVRHVERPRFGHKVE